jgi:hypothetical protein
VPAAAAVPVAGGVEAGGVEAGGVEAGGVVTGSVVAGGDDFFGVEDFFGVDDFLGVDDVDADAFPVVGTTLVPETPPPTGLTG